MIALVDSDICLYRVGYTTENESEEIAQFRMEELVNRILETTQADSYVLYLSAGRLDTFRAKINPDYKAHRTQPKPKHYAFLKQYLIDVWKAEVQVGLEADDAISMMQSKDPDNTIACTIDKDILFQVIGHKYNFVKDTFSYVQDDEAMRYFYHQMIEGDTADNLKGIAGMGKVKAAKFLDSFEGEEEMFPAVFNLYNDPERFWMNADCFWMLREEDTPFSKRKEVEHLKELVLEGVCLES